jgi:PHD/YefM family antitoxin component YafN of YafNO toxin-antitoxin module
VTRLSRAWLAKALARWSDRLTGFCTESYIKRNRYGYFIQRYRFSHARTKLTDLCEQVASEGGEKIITKNGESCAALIDAKRLDHYHRLEREHIHLTILEEVLVGLEDLKNRRILTLAQLKSRHGR